MGQHEICVKIAMAISKILIFIKEHESLNNDEDFSGFLETIKSQLDNTHEDVAGMIGDMFMGLTEDDVKNLNDTQNILSFYENQIKEK
jgi:hypothetical protein